jgi:uncharacterized protein (TIGR03083 family)
VCPGWSAHDIAAHLLADDVGRLSRGRDGYAPSSRRQGEPFVEFINRQNEEWVGAWRRVSPALIVDLLTDTGDQTARYFAALDPHAMGAGVWWATGDDPAPVWLDLARELTERWHHQAQIRDAIGAPPLIDPVIFAPVIATFAFALPRTFRDVDAPPGTAVVLHVSGPSGGSWSIVRETGRWDLRVGEGGEPAARASIDEDTWWRLVTKGISATSAEARAELSGRLDLARRALGAVAVIA